MPKRHAKSLLRSSNMVWNPNTDNQKQGRHSQFLMSDVTLDYPWPANCLSNTTWYLTSTKVLACAYTTSLFYSRGMCLGRQRFSALFFFPHQEKSHKVLWRFLALASSKDVARKHDTIIHLMNESSANSLVKPSELVLSRKFHYKC